MAKRFKMNRITRSRLFANIIISNDLFNEFIVFKYNHPKIKSLYRSANLFLMNKKLRWAIPDNFNYSLTMENIEAFYYG